MTAPPEHEVIIDYLGYIAVAAVLVVLLLGLWNMMRGGSANRSQSLMRWRVGLQFVAIIILMLGLYLSQR
jgi:NADH:ubiquinone oxidoreductase subunit 6 (subunit J)